MGLDYEKYQDGSYDFTVSDDGDLAVIMGAKDSEVDGDVAKIIFDNSDSSATLVRNKDNLVMFEDLPEGLCEMFKDGRKTITVIEVTDENTDPDMYEVPIEINEQ